MNDRDLNEELGDGIQSRILEVQMLVRESEESFIFETIKPFCEENLSREISKKELEEMLLRAERMKWVPCSESLPEEHDSIFAKFKNTSDWKNGMFEKTSNHVIATIKYEDGSTIVEEAHTSDGVWKYNNKAILNGNVIAWMPLPEPYRGE